MAVIERTKASGYEKMEGTDGDDIYVIKDISKTWTTLEDKVNGDSDMLIINNTSSDKLMMFFDFGLIESSDYSYNASIDDGLYILQKNSMTSALTSLLTGNNPKSGGVDLTYFFGDTNNWQLNNEMGTNYGRDYMETIKLVDKNGVEKILDVQATVNAIKSKVTDYLSGTNYNTVMEYLEDGSVSYKEKVKFLTECYQGAELVTELAPGSIDIKYDAKGNIEFIDLSHVNSLHDFTGSKYDTELNKPYDQTFGGIMEADEGYGLYLRTERDGNNLIIEYNGHFEEDGDWVDEKELVIPNYFKKPTDIKIKVNVADRSVNGNLNLKDEPEIFDLKDIVLNCDYYANESKGTATGTILRDDIDGRDWAEEGVTLKTIDAKDGDDVIRGYKGDQKIYGGAGKNMLIFAEGDGNDTVYSNKDGEDTLVFENLTADNITFDTKGNNLIINYGEDSITVVDYLKNPAASSVKYVQFNNEDKEKVSLAELIASKPGIVNGDGELRGSDLADIITGGSGDDKMYGGKGTNTFVFKDGDGNDTIYYEGGTDIIDLRNVENLSAYEPLEPGSYRTEGIKQGNDLIVIYASEYDEATGEEKYDTIRLANYFKNGQKSDIKFILKNDENGNPIYTELKDFVAVDLDFEDAEKGQKITGTFLDDIIDGSEYNDTIHGGAGNDNIVGGKGNDKLYGDSGNNEFEFYVGDGKDIIYSGKGNDLVTFGGAWLESRGLTIDDLSISVKGNSLIIHYTDNDSVELADYFKLKGNHSVKEVEVTKKDGEGTEKYTIEQLIAMHPSTINYKGNTNIKGTVLNDIITGSDKNDTIKGGQGNDTITGGQGNDKLYGEYGDNTFKFSSGDGNDIIYSGKGNDTIVLNDEEDFPNLYLKGNSLVIRHGESTDIENEGMADDSIELYNYFKNKTNSVDKIVLKDGSEYYLSQILNEASIDNNSIQVIGNKNKSNTLRGTKYSNHLVGGDKNDKIYGGEKDDTLEGGKGNDSLYGGAGHNIYYFMAGDGNDTIYSNDINANDTIAFEDINKENVVLFRSGNNLIFQYTENDSITIANYFKKNAICSIKDISFADGDEPFEEFVNNFVNSEGENALEVAKTGKLGNYSKATEGQDINGSRLNDTIIGSKYDDVIYGDRGHDTIKGGAGDDTIYGGSGNDKLYGEAGNNTFVFNNYDGNDTVYMGKGNDTLQFDDSTIENLHYEKSGNHLVIKHGEDDSVTINNYFSTKNKSVDTIIANGETVSLKDDIIIKGIYDREIDIWGDGDPEDFYTGYRYDGNQYNNVIVANNNKNINFVEAGAGNDTIYCQGKLVIANGGEGDDKYVVSSLNNATSIEDIGGEDTLQIADKSSNVNILFDVKANGTTNDLTGMFILNKSNLSKLIKTGDIEGVSKGIEINGFFDESGNIADGAIERIETKDGYITLDQIDAVKSEVATWLTSGGRSYESAIDALSKKPDDINDLLAIYQKIDWQPFEA